MERQNKIDIDEEKSFYESGGKKSNAASKQDGGIHAHKKSEVTTIQVLYLKGTQQGISIKQTGTIRNMCDEELVTEHK